MAPFWTRPFGQTLPQLLHYVSLRIRYLQRLKVCKFTLAGLPRDDWRVSRKAESLFMRQLSQILLVKWKDCIPFLGICLVRLLDHCQCSFLTLERKEGGKKSSFQFMLVALMQRKERPYSIGLHYKSTLEHPAAGFLKG